MEERMSNIEDGKPVEFDNQGWQAELQKVGCLKWCPFPASSEIEIGGTREQATITMKEKGRQRSSEEAWPSKAVP